MKRELLLTQFDAGDLREYPTGAPVWMISKVGDNVTDTDVGHIVLGGIITYISQLRDGLEKLKAYPEKYAKTRHEYDTFFLQLHTLIDELAKLK